MLVLQNLHTTLFEGMHKMFLLFLRDFDILNPMLNDARAYMLSILNFCQKMYLLAIQPNDYIHQNHTPHSIMWRVTAKGTISRLPLVSDLQSFEANQQ